ncbi:MAG: beta-lactamase family protein [Prevotellaceae bacterium]|jgi:CubicO group peptidase (beta-lactamase class C family)|nr:beta-lactamase family protein [Prevotellaceae bacterium]
MKKLILSFVFIQIFCLSYSQQKPQHFVETADISIAFDTARLHRIDAAYQRLVDEGILPNAVTFVAHKGNIVHYKSFGWRDVDKKIPCRKDDIFRMASQTKAIAVVALMTLFEEGRFQLDENIKKYIPEFENPQVIETYNPIDTTYTMRPAKRDITIRHLITHTSGISAYDAQLSAICAKNGIPPLNTKADITLGEAIRRLAKIPLAHDPGEKFTYGISVDVLGYLIEILSEKSVDVFIKERIFDPLGMQDTYFYLPDNKTDRLVTLYEYTKDKKLQRSNHPVHQTFPYEGARKFFSTGAGLNGTIEDYAKFCQMILNDGEFNGIRILGRKTLEMMRHNGVGDLRGEIGFGMAWDVFREQYAHRSIASTGSSRWGGMFGTDYIIDPKEELILLIYVNVSPNFSGIDPKTLLHNVTYQALK